MRQMNGLKHSQRRLRKNSLFCIQKQASLSHTRSLFRLLPPPRDRTRKTPFFVPQRSRNAQFVVAVENMPLVVKEINGAEIYGCPQTQRTPAHSQASRPFACSRYSACQAFKTMMNEVGDLAGQHELIAEDMTSTVLQELQLLVRNLKDDRKKVTGHPLLGLNLDFYPD